MRGWVNERKEIVEAKVTKAVSNVGEMLSKIKGQKDALKKEKRLRNVVVEVRG